MGGARRARDPPAGWVAVILLFAFLLSSLHVADAFSTRPRVQRNANASNNNNNNTPGQQRQQQQERTVVLAYYKPAGIVTTHADDDELGRPNVYNDIFTMKGYKTKSCDDGDDKTMDSGSDTTSPRTTTTTITMALFEKATNIRTKLHAIGRLDADTTGLLLLTNDGGLVHQVTNANANVNANKDADTHSSNVEAAGPIGKTYQAVIMGYHEQDSVLFQGIRRDGVDIGAKYGGWTLPVDNLTVLGHATPKSTTVSLTICQGKNRQVRRMFHAIGSGVMKLQRTRIGSRLTLDGLEQEGDWRILSDQEVRDGLHWTPRVLDDMTVNGSSSSKSKSKQKRMDTPRSKSGRRQRRR